VKLGLNPPAAEIPVDVGAGGLPRDERPYFDVALDAGGRKLEPREPGFSLSYLFNQVII
jgi:hypothetical protein